MFDFHFDNGVHCNESLRTIIGCFLLTLQNVFVPGTIICATCFSDHLIDGKCLHCSELIKYVVKYSSTRRGQKPRSESKLAVIEANAELSIDTLMWPPVYLTHAWEHQRKKATILKKYNPVTIYDGFIESILIAIVLHHELDYNPFKATDIPYFFKKADMLTLCSMGSKQAEFLDIYDRFQKIFSTSDYYVAELFQFISLQLKLKKGHTSDPYKGWLWSKKMILSLLPEAAHIFIEFQELLNGTFTIDNILKPSDMMDTTLTTPVETLVEITPPVVTVFETTPLPMRSSLVEEEAIFQDFRDMSELLFGDEKLNADLDDFMKQTEIERQIERQMAFNSPVIDQTVIESGSPDDPTATTPITQHPGLATFRYKVLQTKEYFFLDRRFKSLVDEITTNSYKLAETLVMLAADVFEIHEPNLDGVCAKIFERKIVVCDENIQMEIST